MKTVVRKAYVSLKENILLAVRYSLILAALLLLIYLIARVSGAYKITELRFINYFVFYPVIHASVRKAFMRNNNYLEYFSGMILSFFTGLLGQLIFAIAFVTYLHFDPTVMNSLLQLLPQPLLYPYLSIFFILVAEGAAASVVIALAVMQLFKRSNGRWAFTRK